MGFLCVCDRSKGQSGDIDNFLLFLVQMGEITLIQSVWEVEDIPSSSIEHRVIGIHHSKRCIRFDMLYGSLAIRSPCSTSPDEPCWGLELLGLAYVKAHGQMRW